MCIKDGAGYLGLMQLALMGGKQKTHVNFCSIPGLQDSRASYISFSPVPASFPKSFISHAGHRERMVPPAVSFGTGETTVTAVAELRAASGSAAWGRSVQPLAERRTVSRWRWGLERS